MGWPEIIVLICLLLTGYFGGRFSVYLVDKLIDFLIPGLPKPERFVPVPVDLGLTEFEKYMIDVLINLYDTAWLFYWICESCYYYYNYYKTEGHMWSDLYHYFRYDFFKFEHAVIKLVFVLFFIGTPIGIWQTCEFGFPKQYYYTVPAIFYSATVIYFCTINFEITVIFIKNSWFFNELYDRPPGLGLELWEDYSYFNRNEPWLVTKYRNIHRFLFITESITFPEKAPFDEYVYESENVSVIRPIYEKFIKPLIPRPEFKNPFERPKPRRRS